MTRLTPEQRRLIGKARRKDVPIKFLVQIFEVSRKTIWYWSKRDLRTNLEDKPRKARESKITVDVEVSILAMRSAGGWGTAKIQQGLLDLPEFMIIDIGVEVQGVKLSRAAINNVLKKHRVNGYKREQKSWKFFRAKKPNELWQLDPKGPFKVRGKKYWILVCIDDYSRFIPCLHLFDHAPNIKEIGEVIKPASEKYEPNKILTDNNPFGDSWEEWCRENDIEALFAHPYYPQDKGKVERSIRTLTEEFVNLLKHFPDWMENDLEGWKDWYNTRRYHRGIETMPAELYV